jgi:UDP-N-acetylmuramate: L-alanyl-gamma-D-glutamyl-meso-diaminopimelate ligase
MKYVPPTGGHIHLIAVCGVGMASLAGLLQAKGYRVTGSDENVYPPMSTYLAQIGIEFLPGYRESHITPRPDLVVIGNAVTRSNPEAQAVLNSGLPYISFPEALGEFLIGARNALVIAGTHGKTTTTALCAWVLERAGLRPGFFVGGVPINFGSGWNPGQGDTIILEGDEYDTAFFDKGPKFLHYRPRNVILTSVEFDHADIYRDLDHVKTAFRRLMEIIPSDGCLLLCNDYSAAGEVAASARCRVISYGDSDGADWAAREIQVEQGRSRFQPCYRGHAEGIVEVSVIGRHNVKNALAVYAMARAMGIERSKLLEGFATFRGVKRRQEVRGEARGVTVIDDFAHHPTAVHETINAVKEAYPKRRLWAVFEPRSHTSRRSIFEQEFARALALADRVIVADLYLPEKVPEGERLSVQKVIDLINQTSGDERAVLIADPQEIATHVAQNAAPGDMVLVMSNGAFGGVHDKILKALAG